MNHLLKYILATLFIITSIGCEKDETEVVEVDSRLQIYFDRFAEEGAIRGVTIDYNTVKISGKIEDITDGSKVAGQCQSNSARANTLIVDLGFWNQSSDIEKEFVIYHELGHCYLDRDHLDDSNDDGTCVSMMHSGTGSCTNVFNANTRSGYLDELFNP